MTSTRSGWSVVHVDDVPGEDGRYPAPFDAELLSFGRDLGTAGATRTIGAWHETLAPGRRTSRLHAHLHEEELIYVLSGHPVVRAHHPDGREERVALRPGSFVAFPAGTGVAHTFDNPTDAPAELFVVGGRHVADRVRYPEDGDLEAWRVAQRPNRGWPTEPVAAGTPYRIDTDRLTLRPLGGEDAPALFDMAVRNRERVRPWLPWAEREPDLERQLAFVRSMRANFEADKDFAWGVLLGGRLVGVCGLHPAYAPDGAEVGYWVDHAAEGRGLASEAVAAVLRAGLGPMGRRWIEARITPGNERSRRLAARLGLVHEATLRGRIPSVVNPDAAKDAEIWTATRAGVGPATQHVAVRMFDALGRALADPLQGTTIG